MKNTIKLLLTNSAFILVASLFIKAGCSKSDEGIEPPLPTSDEYITWNVNKINGALTSPGDSLFIYQSGNTTTFLGVTPYNAPNPGSFYASTNGTSTGIFDLAYFSIFTNNRYYVSTFTQPKVTISTYGNTGEYVIGSYSGVVKDSLPPNFYNATTYSIHGNFKIKRK